MPTETSRYVRASDLAPKYHVTTATILKWQRQGLIPCIRASRRPVLFDPAAVDEALRAKTAAPVQTK